MDALEDCFLVRVDKRSRKLVVHYLLPAGRGSFRPSLFTDFPMSRLKSMSVEQAARYLGHSILIGLKYTRDRLYEGASTSKKASKPTTAKKKARSKSR